MNTQKLIDIQDSLASHGIPGSHLTVFRGYEKVYEHMSGEGVPGKRMQGGENYWFYSASKVICATAGMQLLERGMLRAQDPVSEYLPEYAHLTVRDGDTVRPAATVMTVENLFTMTGGLDYELDSDCIKECLFRYGENASTLDIVRSLARKPLCFDPGTHMQYSLCHDVLAAVIERASGMRYAKYLEKNIFGPLGMKGMTFFPDDEAAKDTCALYTWQGDGKESLKTDNRHIPYTLSRAYESGGAGLYGTQEAYCEIAIALANGGVGRNGERILRPETIDDMRRDRIRGECRRDFDRIGRIGYSYAMGVRTLVDDSKALSPIGEFGWDSAGGAFVLIDPENRISAVYCQHVLDCGYAYDVLHPMIRDAIYES